MPKQTSERRATDRGAGTGAAKPALPALPEARLGFFFAGALFFADLVGTIVADFGLSMFRFLALSAGVAYWLFCVHRLHSIINRLDPKHPITPQTAVALHLPPFFSLYWIFKWPIEFSKFVNGRGFTKMVPGGWLGLALFVCIVMGQIYWGLGLAAIFLVTWYLADKLSYERQYFATDMSTAVQPSTEQKVGGILAGNVVNYMVANTGFVLLLVLPVGLHPVIGLLVFGLIFLASGFAGGVIAGNIGRKSGPAVGLPANLAVVGSIFLAFYLARQTDLVALNDYAVFLVLGAVSFGLSVFGTKVGELWHRQQRHPYLWRLEERELPEAEAEGHTGGADIAQPVVDGSPSPESRWLGGMAMGNIAGAVVLIFYRYPAAFIEYIWGDGSYIVTRIGDSLVIVTGAFIAAYVAMMIAKERPEETAFGANAIMYLTILGLLVRAYNGGNFWADFGPVLPVIPVVAIAGLLGAKTAQNNLNNT